MGRCGRGWSASAAAHGAAPGAAHRLELVVEVGEAGEHGEGDAREHCFGQGAVPLQHLQTGWGVGWGGGGVEAGGGW
jgi:hypothetical protein